MNDRNEKQFLVVAPEEARNIFSFHEVDRYIQMIIVSKPGPKLLNQVSQAIREGGIRGILTRGSLAHYLYSSHVPVPIFHLKYELFDILEMLRRCVEEGFQKICIFEIGYCASSQNPKKQRTHLRMGEYEFIYNKLYDRSEVEQEILILRDAGQLDIVVGDVEPIMAAKRLGIPYRNFLIDECSYLNAVSEARYATDVARKEKSQNDFIEVITNIISEAVVIANEAGDIQRYNVQAECLLMKHGPIRSVQELFLMDMNTLLALPANYLLPVNGRSFIINSIPRLVGQERIHAFVLSSVNDVENLEMTIRRQNQDRGLTAKTSFDDVVYQDPVSKRLVATAQRYAKSNGTIVIHGETGTGKEVIASSIHNASLRADGPFVAINCATFNENLIESELFGYEKGAFTGALSSGKRGLFELAHRGSLFLDEVGELPLTIQAKLLRVLQEREIMRVGGDKIIPVDVRMIAATNKDLREMVRQKTFREDLYYRLVLLEIEIPPLRSRRKDIVPLFISFLAEALQRENRAAFWEDISVFEPILNYDWPGNVRELRNFSERVALLCEGYRLDRSFIAGMVDQMLQADSVPQYTFSITDDLKELERNYIAFLLRRFGGDRDKLCSYLHLSRSTLWRKLNSNDERQ